MKLLQICASENDLFGLDSDGMVYQYNFKTNTWMRLGRGRSHGGGGLDERQPTIEHPEVTGGHDRLEAMTTSRGQADEASEPVAFCECGRPLARSR